MYPSNLGRGGRGRGGRDSSGMSNNSTGGQGRGLSGRLGGRGFGRGLNGRADIVGILNQTSGGGGQLRDDPYDVRGHAASSRGRNPRMFHLANFPDRTTTPRRGASITSAASSAPAASAQEEQ